MIDVREDALEKARATIAGNMDRQIKKGALTEADRDAALGRMSTATEISAVADADLVVEAATENRDLKFRIFEEMDGTPRRTPSSPPTPPPSPSPRSPRAPGARTG
jgi:3-hydroxybutyryl-CoA dehydrogenase